MSAAAVSIADAEFAASSLADFSARAAARAKIPGAYAGEVTPQEAWHALSRYSDALLVDVRTAPEWQFVGVPDLSSLSAKLVPLSWKLYPTFTTNPDFAEHLAAAGATPRTPIFFLCRSGGRSLDAAVAMSALGYGFCFNVTDGFEGEPDADRHRGAQAGWKAARLPWVQG